MKIDLIKLANEHFTVSSEIGRFLLDLQEKLNEELAKKSDKKLDKKLAKKAAKEVESQEEGKMRVDLLNVLRQKTIRWEKSDCSTCIYYKTSTETCINCDGNSHYTPTGAVYKLLKRLEDRLDPELEGFSSEEGDMPEPFIPKIGEEYYYIDLTKNIFKDDYFNPSRSTYADIRAKQGNCFRTRVELKRLSSSQFKELWNKFYSKW